MLIAKFSANTRMSSNRSRNGGKVITSKANLSSKSARNSPAAAIEGKSSLVAATNLALVLMVLEPPTRSNSPYSTTRNNFS